MLPFTVELNLQQQKKRAALAMQVGFNLFHRHYGWQPLGGWLCAMQLCLE
jgi:hypothetical protein